MSNRIKTQNKVSVLLPFCGRSLAANEFIWLLIIVSLIGCRQEKDLPVSKDNRILPAAKTVARGIITASSSSYIEAGNSEAFDQFGIVSMFPRYRVGSEHLLDGFIKDRISESDLMLDTCSQPSPVLKTHQKRNQYDKTSIKLIDVGNISIDYLGTKTVMPTRTFPDLFKVIDGVIYSTDGVDDMHFVPGATYTVHATGTDNVSSFDVVLDAPNDLGEITLNGLYPGDQMPVISRNEKLILTWEGEEYGDEVFVEIHWSGLGMSWSISCRLRDDGRFIIPRHKTMGMYSPLSGNEYEFNISRIRQTAFRSKGLTSGEFCFVVSTNFLVKFEK